MAWFEGGFNIDGLGRAMYLNNGFDRSSVGASTSVSDNGYARQTVSIRHHQCCRESESLEGCLAVAPTGAFLLCDDSFRFATVASSQR